MLYILFHKVQSIISKEKSIFGADNLEAAKSVQEFRIYEFLCLFPKELV